MRLSLFWQRMKLKVYELCIIKSLPMKEIASVDKVQHEPFLQDYISLDCYWKKFGEGIRSNTGKLKCSWKVLVKVDGERIVFTYCFFEPTIWWIIYNGKICDIDYVRGIIYQGYFICNKDSSIILGIRIKHICVSKIRIWYHLMMIRCNKVCWSCMI